MATTTKRPSPYGPVKFNNIDEYHAAQATDVQPLLQQLREAILQAAPDVVENISYNMPAFKLRTNLVYYAAFKRHIGLYPTGSPIKAFEKELAGFATSKGAVQFPLDKPLPVALIKKIVKFRAEEDTAKAKAKAKPAAQKKA